MTKKIVCAVMIVLSCFFIYSCSEDNTSSPITYVRTLDFYIADEFDPNYEDIGLLENETITLINASGEHSVLLTSNGRLIMWGKGLAPLSSTNYDKLIDMTIDFKLDIDEKIISAEIGHTHCSAITSTGRVFMWGETSYQQLWYQIPPYTLDPIDITNKFALKDDDKIIMTSLGVNHSAALSSSGRIYLWGNNESGRLGNGLSTGSSSVIEITSSFMLNDNEKIISVDLGGEHSSALTSLGRVFMWGNNLYGQLGNDTNINKLLPIDITNMFELDEEEIITSVKLGYYHSSALTSKSRMFMWGKNTFGQLGDGTTISNNKPTDITDKINLYNNEKIMSMNMGKSHSSALTSYGRLFMWGYNGLRQISTKVDEFVTEPVDKNNLITLNTEEEFIMADLGDNFTVGLTNMGRLLLWGDNSAYQLGNPATNLNIYSSELRTYRFNLYATENIVSMFNYEPKIPKKDGYTFSGWHYDQQMDRKHQKDYFFVNEKLYALYGYWIKVCTDNCTS